MQNRGFSLIELMLVIGIIGIIAVFAVPMMSSNRCRADAAEVQSCITDSSIRLENYRTNHGKYPASATVIADLGYADLDCGNHYRGVIVTSNTQYAIRYSDLQDKLNCSTDPGDDEWVMINTSPQIYHTKNPYSSEVDTVPSGGLSFP